MSCLTLAELLAAQAPTVFGITSIWGDATLIFEDREQAELAEVVTGWTGRIVTSEADGIPEIDIQVLPQSAVTEAMLDVECRFLVLKGRRHEKRTYEYRKDAPERHHLRFVANGEAV